MFWLSWFSCCVFTFALTCLVPFVDGFLSLFIYIFILLVINVLWLVSMYKCFEECNGFVLILKFAQNIEYICLSSIWNTHILQLWIDVMNKVHWIDILIFYLKCSIYDFGMMLWTKFIEYISLSSTWNTHLTTLESCYEQSFCF